MKYIFGVFFVLLLLIVVRCSDIVSQLQNPPGPDPITLLGETGLIHDDSVFYEQPVYWVQAPISAPIPAKWDLREKATVFPTPGDQGNCGSCWAYSTHQAHEIWHAVNKGTLFDFSPQFLLSCSGEGSCGGGYMSVVSWLAKSGLPPESDFPYKAADIKCKYSKSEIDKGFGNQVIEAPWVGESFEKSRYWKASGKVFQAPDKIKQIQAAMLELNSPAVVTVSAYGSNSDAVVSSCSALNSGGNHMVDVIGWDDENGSVNAHVYNSWGSSHGKGGVSRLKWDCNGKLNRGLGVSARVLRGDTKPPCDPPGNPNLKPEQIIFLGSKTEIGTTLSNVKCAWSPVTGLKDPTACKTDAMPEKSTEYHLEVSNECGKVSAMTFIRVFAPVAMGGGAVKQEESKTILTPFGEVAR